MFQEWLQVATQNIGHQYFQVPVAGKEHPIYRERVYCYELYHQLRLIIPDHTGYSLGGEIDKSGHQLIRGNGLDRAKPDLLIHVPGDMEDNLLVLEVKPTVASRNGVIKDLKTLTAFRRHGRYDHAVLLVYGEQIADFLRIREWCVEAASSNKGSVDLSLIQLWFHTEVGSAANWEDWYAL